MLELGCGLGLASLVLHRRGGNITASDAHPLAEDFFKANLLLNGLGAMKFETSNWGRESTVLGEFDLIIASDVLYDRDQPVPLAEFVRAHAAPGAQVLIVDPNRGNHAQFRKAMVANGYSHTSKTVEPQRAEGIYRGKLHSYTH